MVGWHHQLNGHEFEQTPRVGEGQRCLACCSPWGRKESDMTEQLNSNKGIIQGIPQLCVYEPETFPIPSRCCECDRSVGLAVKG